MTTGSSTTTDLHTVQRPQNLHRDSSCFGPLINHKQPGKPPKNIDSDSQIRSCVNSGKEGMTRSPNILLANLEREVLVQPSTAVLDNKTASVSIEIINVSFWTAGSRGIKDAHNSIYNHKIKSMSRVSIRPSSLEAENQMPVALFFFFFSAWGKKNFLGISLVLKVATSLSHQISDTLKL